MSRNPYAGAVNAVLKPHGFHKVSGIEWQREVDGYLDDVYMHSVDKAFAVHVRVRDIATKALVERAKPPKAGGSFYSASSALGLLMSRYAKRWPRDDPDGPSQVAAAIEAYALPFLEGLHSIDAMTDYKRRQNEGRWWGDTNHRLDLAVLLWRQGRSKEACDLLQNPPKRIPDSLKTSIEAVRRFVCETPPPAPEG